ncbi:MAG: addiction module protein [Candidatus Hydrogenedentes bacterium]|nr:addiction module protein [Candidatus Hydrogenedentota bacterium]
MNVSLDEIKTQLGSLDASHRAELAHFLLTSLGPEEVEPEEDFDQLLLRRLEEIKSGQVAGTPWETVMAELEALDPE